MRILVWLFRALLFFTLFAFALNNLHTATVHWFFGMQWSAPLVIVVLAAFGAGCALGVLSMVPAWLRSRRQAQRAPAADAAPSSLPAAGEPVPEHPPRDGV
jgi:uncharacterized integral membrane protein